MSFLFGAFILTAPGFAQTPSPAAAPAAPAETIKPAMHHERHQELHKAMRKLRGAKEELEKAANDYGGHKLKAIEAINTALAELRAALAFDKK